MQKQLRRQRELHCSVYRGAARRGVVFPAPYILSWGSTPLVVCFTLHRYFREFFFSDTPRNSEDLYRLLLVDICTYLRFPCFVFGRVSFSAGQTQFIGVSLILRRQLDAISSYVAGCVLDIASLSCGVSCISTVTPASVKNKLASRAFCVLCSARLVRLH